MEEKYLHLLDQEVLTFIQETETFYPADAIHASIDEQREYYDALCKAYDTGYPTGVQASDEILSINASLITVRNYNFQSELPKAHVLFFHGGGFVVGGLESHDSICAEFCAGTKCSVTSVDYRLAPEHPHPASFDDCLAVYRHLSDRTEIPIIVVGDSAGGNLAAAVSHAVRGKVRSPQGQVLIYPALRGDLNKGSYVEHANAPLLTTQDINFYDQIRAGNAAMDSDVIAHPLADQDFSNLPETIIFTAQCDPLCDDGRDYCDAINRAGGNATWLCEDGLVHGYLRARTTSKVAKASFGRIVSAINTLARAV
ncbi:MAG: alpha/beta hydrolase [Pseudomonadota bacterium]